jgi:hypothetical protein
MLPKKNKPIKVDWEALEDAFNAQEDELLSYLDRVTGHVVLEGEGEEEGDDLEDEAARYGSAGSSHVDDLPTNDSTRIYVEPPDAEEKVEWMKEFLDGQSQIDAAIATELRAALQSGDADEACSILNGHPPVRDEWYRFRSDRLHQKIDDWLEDYGIVAVDEPPWRR